MKRDSTTHPPEIKTALCESAADGKGQSKGPRDDTAARDNQQFRQTIPSDARMVGIVIDRENEARAHEILIALAAMQNQDAYQSVKVWRHSNKPFLVLAFQPSAKNGFVGGWARDWSGAREILLFTLERLERLAERYGAFTSAWVYFVTPERRRDARTLIALAQPVMGHA